MNRKLVFFLAMACPLAVALTTPASAQGDLLITLVVDGDLTHEVTGGGSPKFVELFALNDIPDLSVYALSRAGNGAPHDTITVDHVLPSTSLSAGEYYYVAGSSFQDYTIPFNEIFPDKSAVRNFGVNSNGNDATLLFHSPSGDFSMMDEVVVDTFGTEGVDGSGTEWFHADGYALSNNGRLPSATFDPSEWTVMAGALDGLDVAGHAAELPVMTYVVPEPASVALLLVGCAALTGIRRR